MALMDLPAAVTPSGRKFLVQKLRYLTGLEYLALQHIYPHTCDTWSDDQKKDLAGNAFNGLTCQMAVLCLLSNIPRH